MNGIKLTSLLYELDMLHFCRPSRLPQRGVSVQLELDVHKAIRSTLFVPRYRIFAFKWKISSSRSLLGVDHGKDSRGKTEWMEERNGSDTLLASCSNLQLSRWLVGIVRNGMFWWVPSLLYSKALIWLTREIVYFLCGLSKLLARAETVEDKTI